MSVAKLSDLTPPVVDRIYGTDRATPRAEPTFVLLVGAPGVGKSSGHAFAIENGFLPPPSEGGYATINLDMLLESLRPFRAASSIGYIATHKPSTKDHAKFSAFHSYISRHEDVGAFKMYNDTHNAIAGVDPELVSELNSVRGEYMGLRDIELPKGSSILNISEAAIERAVERSVPIIYETTLSFSKKKGRVKKVDDIVELLRAKGPQYRIVLVHMTAPPEEIAARIHQRQEYGMPYEKLPFYRYFPTDPEDLAKVIEPMVEAVSAVASQYSDRIEVVTLETVMDASRLAAPIEFDDVAMVRRIRNVYGPASAAAAGGAGAKKTSSDKDRKRRRSKTSSSERHRRNAAATQKKSRSK